MTILLTLLLAGCDLEQLGIYTCDEYCDQMVNRAEDCAAEDGMTLDDWSGSASGDVVTACQDDLDSQDMTDTECQAQTGTINNMTCDQIQATVLELL